MYSEKEKNHLNSRYEELAKQAKKTNSDLTKIKHAFEFAYKQHETQKRKSGEPYIIHPLETSIILAEFGFSTEVIEAALLHDILEDTPVSDQELKKEFGETVYNLVDGVTKLAKISDASKEFGDNLYKIFLATSKDVRVILIKLADNLHNMRTIDHLPSEKQETYARKCLTAYVPIAKKLGLNKIRRELEEIAFKYAEPEKFSLLEQQIENKRKEKLKEIKEVIDILKKDKLNKKKPEYDIIFRSVYTLYNKMHATGKSLDELHDSLILTIKVDNVDDCYYVLGRIHQTFKPKPRKVKDFISFPQDDLYQSIHTTILGPRGNNIKIYIRTREMQETIDYGIASFFARKKHGLGLLQFLLQRGSPLDKELPEKVEDKTDWIQDVISFCTQNKISGDQDFIETLKCDFLEGNIIVFSSKGECISLPVGSTVLDFAYFLSKVIGDRTKSGKVNGKIVPLWQELQPGDQVDVITDTKKQVKEEWLDYAKSQKVIGHIKRSLEKSRKKKSKGYNVKLFAKVIDKPGILYKVTQYISSGNINITSLNAISSNEKVKKAELYFTLFLTDIKKFKRILEEIKELDGVFETSYEVID